MPEVESGVVTSELSEEFPGLALRYVVVDRGSGRSPREVKQRLRMLSDRFTGGEAVNLRQKLSRALARVREQLGEAGDSKA
jgi:hypothetical protein